jgi:hypothetical protein
MVQQKLGVEQILITPKSFLLQGVLIAAIQVGIILHRVLDGMIVERKQQKHGMKGSIVKSVTKSVVDGQEIDKSE